MSVLEGEELAGQATTRLASQLSTSPQAAPVTEAVAIAVELVANEIGAANIPDAVLVQAVVIAASDLINSTNAPNGVQNFTDGMGGSTPVRVAKDPLNRARPYLAPYLTPVIA